MIKLSIVTKLSSFLASRDQGRIRVSCSGLDTDTEAPMQLIWKISKGDMTQSWQFTGFLQYRFSTPKYDYAITMSLTLGYSDANTYYDPNYVIDPQVFVNCLRASRLSDDFEIELVNVIGDDIYISFIARTPGDESNLTINQFVFPNVVGNSGMYFETLNGLPELFNFNRKVYLRAYIEKYPNVYEMIYQTYRNMGEKAVGGTYYYDFDDIGFVLKDFLELQPIYEFCRILRGNDIVKRFKIDVFEEVNKQRGYTVSATYPNELTAYPENHILNASRGFKDKEFNRMPKNLLILNNHSDYNMISPCQPAWFSILYDGKNSIAGFDINYIGYDNGLLDTYSGFAVDRSTYSGVLHIPVMVKDVSQYLLSQELAFIEIEVWSFYTSIEPYRYRFRYYIDYSHRANEKWLYYLNSLGGLDSIRVYDNEGTAMGLEMKSFEKRIDVTSDIEDNKGQQISAIGTDKSAVTTGWIEKRYKGNFRDLALSNYIYEVDQDSAKAPLVTNEYTHEDETFTENPLTYNPMTHDSTRIVLVAKELKDWENDIQMAGINFDYKKAHDITGIVHDTLKNTNKYNQREFIEYNITDLKVIHYLSFDVWGLNLQVYLDGELMPNPSSGGGFSTEYGPNTFNLTIDPIVNRPVRTIRLVGYLITHLDMTVTQGAVPNPNVSMHVASYRLPNIYSFGLATDAIILSQMVEFVKKHSATLKKLQMMYHKSSDMMTLLKVIHQSYKNFTLNAWIDPTIGTYNTISTSMAVDMNTNGHNIALL